MDDDVLKDVCGEFGFVVKVTDKSVSQVEFEVEEIIGRTNEDNEIRETQPYLKCYIRWDSCSHFWFGDGGGYLHLCGVEYYKKHVELIRWLYDKAFELMGEKPRSGEEWDAG